MALESFDIDPDSKLDYGLDWGPWMDENDAITSSSWAIEPGGPTLSDESSTGDRTVVYVEGCTEGEVYELTNTIETSEGRTAERTIKLYCEER